MIDSPIPWLLLEFPFSHGFRPRRLFNCLRTHGYGPRWLVDLPGTSGFGLRRLLDWRCLHWVWTEMVICLPLYLWVQIVMEPSPPAPSLCSSGPAQCSSGSTGKTSSGTGQGLPQGASSWSRTGCSIPLQHKQYIYHVSASTCEIFMQNTCPCNLFSFTDLNGIFFGSNLLEYFS